jgi:hypothetical protein
MSDVSDRSLTIHGYETYDFSLFDGVDTFVSTYSSYNEFKKFAGFMGYVTEIPADGEDPVVGAEVEIFDKNGQSIGVAVTDTDGFWMIPYKHKGKSAIFTIKLLAGVNYPEQSLSVSVKANGFASVDFEVDVP